MPQSTGTTLTEILISMLLIGILLLGVDAMQVISLKQTKANYDYAVAISQMNNMLERLSIDNHPDVFTWNQQNQRVLPAGRGVINNNELAIFWGNPHENASGSLHIRFSIN